MASEEVFALLVVHRYRGGGTEFCLFAPAHIIVGEQRLVKLGGVGQCVG